MKFYKLNSVMDSLKKYNCLAKDNSYISITEWSNGEGFDITISDKSIMSLTRGELDAIDFLIKSIDYNDRKE